MKTRPGLLAALAILAATYLAGLGLLGFQVVGFVPLFALLSIGRITIVYFIALAVGLAFGILSATSRTAERIFVPLFDVGQSVPILGYFPVVLVFLIALFPRAVGTELGVLFLLFTAMEWNIFFGVVGAVKSVPSSVSEAARSYGFTGSNYLKHVVIPAIIPALLSASVLAWNDGWTFDVASEFVQFGNGSGGITTYSVSGLGAFIQAATQNRQVEAAWFGVLVMGEIIFLTNQLIWHRLQNRVSRHKPVFATMIREDFHTPLRLRRRIRRVFNLRFRHEVLQVARLRLGISTRVLAAFFAIGLLVIGFLVYARIPSTAMANFADDLIAGQVYDTPLYSLFSIGRLMIAYLACVVISLVAAVMAVTHKNFPKYFYPLYDLGRSVPYLAIFLPLFVTLSATLSIALSQEITSFVLLFLAMIWYLLFNVVSAARALPTELTEVSALFGLAGWKRVVNIIIPGVLPAFITGSLLAWGGGWNVIIYSEYIQLAGQAQPSVLPGLGALLDNAAYLQDNVGVVVFYLFIMSGIVILLERTVWRRLLKRVERFGVEFT